MKLKLVRSSALAFCVLAAVGLCHAAKPSAKDFADVPESVQMEKTHLSENATALFLTYYWEIPLSTILAKGDYELSIKKISNVEKIHFKLLSLTNRLGPAPWAWKAVDDSVSPVPVVEKQPWQKIEGFTKEKKSGDVTLGPLVLRKTTEDLDKSLKDAKGITLGFANNRLLHRKGVWNTEGTLHYPIAAVTDGGKGKSMIFSGGPAVGWKVAPSQEAGKVGVEEATYSLALNFNISPGGEIFPGTFEENMERLEGRTYSARWLVKAKPYLQTDFSGGHRIKGGEATAEYVGSVFHSDLVLGGFQDLYRGSPVQYQMKLIPKLDYSEVEKIGVHSKRKLGDDWLRLGLTAAAELRVGAATRTPFDIGLSYSFLNEVRGDSNHGHLFNADAVWWFSENAGLNLTYARGDTPVADKEINQVTLGFEFKY